MFNKVDKCFFISAITIAVLLALSLLATLILSIFNLDIFLEMVFGFVVIITFLFLPISIVTQIITFIIKIFSSNKTKKDWIISGFNCFSIILLSTIFYFLFLITFKFDT